LYFEILLKMQNAILKQKKEKRIIDKNQSFKELLQEIIKKDQKLLRALAKR